MLLKVAEMVVVPGVLPVTTPFVPAVLLMDAIPLLAVPQVTEPAKSCVLPSENVPVAASCSVEPAPTVRVAGVMVTETSAFAVRVVDPDTPRVAIIDVEPAVLTLATPRVPDTLLMVAIELFDELHVTNVVKSCVEPSANVPTAVNFWDEPATTLGLAGVITMDTGPCTVMVAVPKAAAYAAVMVVVPIEREEAMPPVLIVAIPVSEELHVTSDVTSRVVLFDKVAIAENCRVAPAAIVGFAGETAREVTVAAVKVVEPEIPVNAASIVVWPVARAVVFPVVLIVATLASDELQVARLVKSWVAPLDNVPVALNC